MSIKEIITPHGSFPGKPVDRRFSFLSLYAEYCQVPIKYISNPHSQVYRGPLGTYSCLINDKQIIIDFSDLTKEGIQKEVLDGKIPYYQDSQKLKEQPRKQQIVHPVRSSFGRFNTRSQLVKTPIQQKTISFTLPVVKMHYYPEEVSDWKNVYPAGPWLDLFTLENMKYFFQLCEQNIYTCNNNTILNNQNAHSRALQRRKHVQDMLKKNYGDLTDCSYQFENQKYFWDKFKNCLVSVVVGGARPDMVDRGMCEQLGLGVCMIFSGHSDLFANRKKLQPWKEYIPVYSDYSNLVERIEWCKNNRQKCKEIGNNARQFFLNYCEPYKYLENIEQVMKDHYAVL